MVGITNNENVSDLTIVTFTLCHDLRSETLASTIFEDRFPPYVLTVVNQFNVILMENVVG